MGRESVAPGGLRTPWRGCATAVNPELVRAGGVEIPILAGDQIVGQRKARHRLEPPRPRCEIRPTGDVEPAFGHENHAAPAADIGDRAVIADEERLAPDGLVDKGPG